MGIGHWPTLLLKVKLPQVSLLLETIYLQKHDFLSLSADTFTLHLWMETLHELEVLLVIPLLSKKETLWERAVCWSPSTPEKCLE
jgi:hypothetical protein